MRQRVATAAAAVALVGGADALALAPPASMKSPLELLKHHRQWHHGHHHHRRHRRNRRWGGSRGTTSVANSAGSDDPDREAQYNGEGGVPGDYSLLGYGGKTPPLERLTLYSDDGWTLSAPQRYSVSDWYALHSLHHHHHPSRSASLPAPSLLPPSLPPSLSPSRPLSVRRLFHLPKAPRRRLPAGGHPPEATRRQTTPLTPSLSQV